MQRAQLALHLSHTGFRRSKVSEGDGVVALGGLQRTAGLLELVGGDEALLGRGVDLGLSALGLLLDLGDAVPEGLLPVVGGRRYGGDRRRRGHFHESSAARASVSIPEASWELCE